MCLFGQQGSRPQPKQSLEQDDGDGYPPEAALRESLRPDVVRHPVLDTRKECRLKVIVERLWRLEERRIERNDRNPDRLTEVSSRHFKSRRHDLVQDSLRDERF